MKYAFISDIHSNLPALEAVLKDIEDKGIPTSRIYNLGDAVGYGPFPNEVVALLKEKEIKGILGNYDEAIINYVKIPLKEGASTGQKAKHLTFEYCNEETKDYLETLPRELRLYINGVEILLVHGSPNAINEYLFAQEDLLHEAISKEREFDLLISGHTHLHYVKEVSGKVFTNTASVGKPKDGDYRAGYITIEFDEGIDINYVKVAYDVNKMVEATMKSELPDELGLLLEKGVGKL